MRLSVSTIHRSYRSASLQVALAAALLTGASTALAQALGGAEPGPAATAPAASAPAVHPTPHAATAPAPATEKSGITTVEKVTGTISGTGVYVRPTPAANTYRLAQMKKDDTVEIVGTSNGWYQILPPAGVFCVIVKEYTEVAADGKSATVKADFVNVRAGSALDTERVDYVVNKVRKGTKLTVVGNADIAGVKYLKIAPPEGTVVYISSQFVKLPAGTTLVPAKVQSLAPNLIPQEIVDVTPVDTTQENPTTAVAQTKPAVPEATTQIVVIPQPTSNVPKGAWDKFNELNTKTADELRKKPSEQKEVGTLLDSWNSYLKSENLPATILESGKVRVDLLQKALAYQKMGKEEEIANAALAAKLKNLQEERKTVEEKIKASEATSGYLAEGTLEASKQVPGSYRLVDPVTARTVAYVQPTNEFKLETLIGQYIGVRGSYVTAPGKGIQEIKVSSAALIPAPKLGS